MGQNDPLDRIDRRILRLLQAGGRLTNQALADRVSLSPSACLARVRRLERIGIIQDYHARLDPFRIGGIGIVMYVEVTLEGRQPDEQSRFEAAIQDISWIVEASDVSGDIDYLLKVVASDMGQWTRRKEELMRADLAIRRITTHVLMSKPKYFTGYPVPDE